MEKEKIIKNVVQMIEDVRNNGDKAVVRLSKMFGEEVSDIEVLKDEIKKAYKSVDKESIDALKQAAKNITSFAKEQMKQFRSFETVKKGIVLGQKVAPIEKVGCYVPGGRYPLPSSALMSVIPAKVAGVKEIIMCSPKIQPITVVAADIAGADRIFRIGGVQAIAAMAYGTKTVPKVDKIVGPGNKYVTETKRQVFGDVGIDFIAGPSEVLIIADKFADPKIVAADMLAQAEHDEDAVPLCLASEAIADSIKEEIKGQLEGLGTKETAEKALQNGGIIIVKNMGEAIKIANEMAPEHLELQIKNPEKYLCRFVNFGSMFIGENSAEVFGDYCAGPNHILPTSRAARYTGGLSVNDFVRLQTYQKITKKAASRLSSIAEKLAEIEGLDAHKKSAKIRKEKFKNYINKNI
ncbi:histidinol dehydrogenase [candidate division KSB1 bacterium]